MEKLVIDTEKLSLKAGHRYLLNNINWQVKQGEHWIVFGMNGCGKTTLLSILAGFKQATRGKVRILGETYAADNVLEMRKRIGWVSSSFFDKIYSRESALDIVLSGKFGTVGLDMDICDADIKKAKLLLKELHLEGKIYRPFHLMSKGERQNVLIARALMGDPEILMLDEPCTGLDIGAREYLLSTVKDLANNSNMTIIYVTHHTDEIMPEVFRQTLLLKDGMEYKKGATEELFTTSVLSSFLGMGTTVKAGEVHGYETRVSSESNLAQLLKVGV